MSSIFDDPHPTHCLSLSKKKTYLDRFDQRTQSLLKLRLGHFVSKKKSKRKDPILLKIVYYLPLPSGLIIISIYTPPSTSPTYIPPYQAPKGLPDKSLDILGLRLCGSVNTQQSIVHVNK